MLEWLFGDPVGDAMVRAFYGRAYDTIRAHERFERLRLRLVASAEFIDEAGWQLKA